MIVFWFIYQCWMFIQGTTLALSFLRDLHNLTVVYKPNAFVYHICQTSHQINFKRIRWHYESSNDSINESDTHCKRLFNNSDCFEFYYGTSTSVLVIKEPDMYIGKYTCHVNINSTYEMTSSGYIDVKLPLNNLDDDDDESMGMYNEKELGKLAVHYNVPFILDENDLTSFGKRVQIGGSFQTTCQSVESSHSIHFLWIHLRNSSDIEPSERTKTIRFIHNDGRRIKIQNKKYSSTLSIHPVEHADDGDYVCIASNVLGRSFSSARSLIVTERMILPRIRDNLRNHTRFDLQEDRINELHCIADAYPEADVSWFRASDMSLLARNFTRAKLTFDNEMHGMNRYICEARNKHGLTKIFISVLIPDNQTKPLLSYTDLQSESILLSWRVSNGRYDRFNHFIIYYRRLQNSYDNLKLQTDIINTQDYKQILVDPRTTHYSFTFRIMDLIPYTNYEFRLKGFIGATPSAYSNSVIVKTLETVPEKIEDLHGYVWNETTVIVHWTPVNSTNGPNFYYVLYYTTNTSIPFDQWTNVVVRTYPFYILTISIPFNYLLFIRVASVNAKGSILSDFHIINRTIYNRQLILPIENFRCLSDDHNQLFSIEWSIDYESRLYIKKYILYYIDITETNDDLIRRLLIPITSLSMTKHQSYEFYKYEFNSSLFDLNYNINHKLRLQLAYIDRNENHMPISDSSIYCSLTRKSGKTCKFSLLMGTSIKFLRWKLCVKANFLYLLSIVHKSVISYLIFVVIVCWSIRLSID